MHKLFVLTFCCALVCGAAAQSAAPASQNPTAIIKTTAGDFTCELFKDKVPNAVNNFIGLATGTKPWRDPATHEMEKNKPLYNGTIFHRVIPEFMIQGGDPLGNGQGDPGYTFKDEYVPGLNFDQPGMLAYANSGQNTNGSQFFITEVAVPSLNPCLTPGGCNLSGHHFPKGYGYTIFGQCTPVSLVSQIARAPRDANDKPYHPVKIIHISILKPGQTAPAPATKPATGASSQKPKPQM